MTQSNSNLKLSKSELHLRIPLLKFDFHLYIFYNNPEMNKGK